MTKFIADFKLASFDPFIDPLLSSTQTISNATVGGTAASFAVTVIPAPADGFPTSGVTIGAVAAKRS